MRKATLLIAAVLLVGLLTFVGCGGTTAPTTSAPPPGTTPVQATTSAPPTSSAPTTPAASKIELSVVNFLPDIPPGGLYARKFQENVAKISNGTITLKMAGPEAMPAADTPSAAQRGSIDIANTMHIFLSSLIPGADCLSRAEFSPQQMRADNNPALKFMQDGANKVGLYYLGASCSSIPQAQTVVYTGRSLSTLAELKGWKIAATGGSNRVFIEKIGAVCVPVDFTDYYTSMERGTVDGYNIGIPGAKDFGLIPVTKGMIDEPFSSNGGAYVMNLNKWNSLTQEQKDIMTQAITQTEIDVSNLYDQIVEEIKAELKAAGVQIIKFNEADSKAYYNAYQDSMWEEDMKKWPNEAAQMKQWIIDPNFPRK